MLWLVSEISNQRVRNYLSKKCLYIGLGIGQGLGSGTGLGQSHRLKVTIQYEKEYRYFILE